MDLLIGTLVAIFTIALVFAGIILLGILVIGMMVVAEEIQDIPDKLRRRRARKKHRTS